MSHCVSQTSPCVPRNAVAPLAAEQRRPPLDELVDGAERQADAARPGRTASRRGRSGEVRSRISRASDRRHEALREVAEPIVVVAREAERVLQPRSRAARARRCSARRGTGSARARQQPQEQRRERKAPVRRDQDRRADQHRRHLHQPGRPIVGTDARDDERGEDDGEQESDGEGQGGPQPFSRWSMRLALSSSRRFAASTFGRDRSSASSASIDRRRDDEAREPLVVRGHDVPRRVLRGGVPDHVLVRRHVVVPVAALLGVAGENFQFFAGSSSRARKRRFCSSFETCRKNFRIT